MSQPSGPQPQDAPPRGPEFSAHELKEQVLNAPQLLLIRALDRVLETMAADQNPMAAYRALTATLRCWAEEDPAFKPHAMRVRAKLDRIRARNPMIPATDYVGLWLPVWIGVMRRAGMFDKPGLSNPKTPDDRGRGRLSNRGERTGAPS